ncbi:MAG: hypothetical protein Q4F84_04655, partial [Fibrobacter sp.]|nr:hypothetical protein [Fibrobacter sp.]
MKILLICVMAVTLFNAELFGKEKDTIQESRMKIGILDLQMYGDAEKHIAEISESIETNLKQTGLYDIFRQKQLTEIVNKHGSKMPENISDPQTVIAVGRVAAVDRMLYGYV